MEWPIELKTQWIDECEKLALFPHTPPPDFPHLLDDFGKLYDVLLDYNQKVNLTRITEPKEFLFRHCLDALLPLPYIPQNAKLADVGSGAGFPALPIALARLDVTVMAIESIQKKCKFIELAGETLNLSQRLTVTSERSELLGQSPTHRETFDVVTARAVAALPTLLELTLPLLKPGGLFIALKGPTYQDELSNAQHALKTLGGVLKTSKSVDIQETLHSVILVFEKQYATPAQYPRHSGAISKKSL